MVNLKLQHLINLGILGMLKNKKMLLSLLSIFVVTAIAHVLRLNNVPLYGLENIKQFFTAIVVFLNLLLT